MNLKKKYLLLSSLALALFTGCEDDNKDDKDELIGYEEEDFEGDIEGGFRLIEEDSWSKNTVNKILNTFTYGIVASQEQIEAWVDMPPEEAIEEIITMDGFNKKLRNRENTFLTEEEDKLEYILQEASVRYPNSAFNFNARLTNGELLSVLIMDNTNYNPTRLKVGLWETNYHQVINSKVDALFSFNVYHYFDDIVEGIENNIGYQNILSKSATSSPIMYMYKQFENKFTNNKLSVNDDFAREYNQLFFGILGKNDLAYYEDVTIENTARALTGIDANYDSYTTINGEETLSAPSYYIKENAGNHYHGMLEILGEFISHSGVKEALEEIARIAITKNESIKNLPVMIINGLADSNLENNSNTTQRIINEWKENVNHPDLLSFIRKYAISKEFHSETRLKYLSSLDRLMKTYNLLNFEGKKPYSYTKLIQELEKENYKIFFPAKGVFGNLTGEDIINNSNIISAFYNRAANQEYSGIYPGMDFSKMIDKDIDNNVKDITEFIWNRFVGDNLKNFGQMERLHIYSLLLYGKNYNDYIQSDIDYTEEYIESDIDTGNKIIDMSEEYIDINTTNIKRNLKYVTNFVLGLPFMWFEEGK